MEFADLCDVFASHCQARGLSPRTMDSYGFHLRRFGLWLEGNRIPVTKIDHYVLDRFVTELQKRASQTTSRPLSRAGVNSTIRTLRLFFGYISSCPELWTRKNPAEKLKLLKFEPEPKKMLEPKDVEALLRACNKRTIYGFRAHLQILFLWDSGCRLSEMLSMKRADVDTKNGLARVRRKGGRIDTIPLGYQLRQAMFIFSKKYHEGKDKIDSEYYFSSKDGEPMTSRNFQHTLDRITKRAKLGHAHAHLFRKSAACYMTKEQVPARAIMEKFGWRTMSMLVYYTRSLDSEQLRNVLDKHSPGDAIRI